MADTTIDIKGYKQVKRLLDAVADRGISNQPLFNEIGLFLAAQIKQRTAEGVDAERVQFKPYSTGHAVRRARLGLPIDRVDLFFTGSMLSSMTHEVSQNQVRLFFMPTSDKFGGYNPAKAFFINEDQDREFFAISQSDADRIMDLAVMRLEQMLNADYGRD